MNTSEAIDYFKGKRFLVTGGASGIGEAVCERLQALGANVVILDSQEPRNGNAEFKKCNVASKSEVATLAASISTPLFGVVNAAGVSSCHSPLEILNINLGGAINVASIFSAIVAPESAFVCVASSAGNAWRKDKGRISRVIDSALSGKLNEFVTREGLNGRSAYVLSKEAVIYHYKRFAFEHIDKGLRAVSLSPGLTDTPMLNELKGSLNPKVIEKLEDFRGGEVASAATIAEVVVSMLHPNSRWINGVDLVVDGGAHLALEFE
jgi:NAD(P)-dependent dehydrogenase (short-subunit alcohol dehydrogenase family)